MFSCCKHVYMPKLYILNVWDNFLKLHNSLVLACATAFLIIFQKAQSHISMVFDLRSFLLLPAVSSY